MVKQFVKIKNMKIKILGLLILMLTSCSTRHIEIIDDCEYIVTRTNTGDGISESLTHKRNCKNPIHSIGNLAKPDSIKTYIVLDSTTLK